MTDATVTPPRPAPPDAKAVWVTPAIATEWLNLNVGNRKLRESHAESFARDMRRGKWEEKVGAAIHFIEGTGQIGDGQHRLRAVEIAGELEPNFAGIWFYVVHVPSEAISSAVDKGARRSIVDGLHFNGIKANPVQAALARKIIQMREGYAPGGAGRLKPSDSEIAEVLTGEHSEAIRKASSVAMKIRKEDKLKARPGNVAIAYFLAHQVNPACAEEFFEKQILLSEGLTYESPANALVRRLQNAHNKRMTDVEQYNNIVHAWNHYRKGNLLKRLQEPESWGPNGYALPL